MGVLRPQPRTISMRTSQKDWGPGLFIAAGLYVLASSFLGHHILLIIAACVLAGLIEVAITGTSKEERMYIR